MIGYDYFGEVESLLSLSIPFEKVFNEDLTIEESPKNIRNNVVVVYGTNNDGSQNASSGLMITTDGFILTSFHSIYNWKKEFGNSEKEIPSGPVGFKNWREERIVDFGMFFPGNGRRFALDLNYAVRVDYDLALVKAILPSVRTRKPIRFRVDGEYPTLDEEVSVFGILTDSMDSIHYNALGRVVYVHCNPVHYHGRPDLEPRVDTFEIDARGQKGFSGGVFVDNQTGSLIGIVTYANVLHGRNISERIGGAPIGQVRDFIRNSQARFANSCLERS